MLPNTSRSIDVAAVRFAPVAILRDLIVAFILLAVSVPSIGLAQQAPDTPEGRTIDKKTRAEIVALIDRSALSAATA